MQLHKLVSTSFQSCPSNTAVAFDDGENSQAKTYSIMLDNVEEISSCLSSLQVREEIVAVILNQTIDVPAILLGILSNDCCYFPLAIDNGKKFILEGIKRSGATWIIHDSSLKEVLSFCVEQLNGEYIDTVRMSKFPISLVHLHPDSCQPGIRKYQNEPVDDEKMAYCITTSGTTGRPKVIRVPHSCIVPNIMDFSKIFQIGKEDSVLLTAPLTFDPSVVDIFMALSNGAKLVIVPDQIKQNPSQFVNVLHSRQNVTILQATPSLIRRCSPEMLQQTILGPNSSLRILALGGEEFPSPSELRKWVHPLNTTRVYNLYGITEVSCWATYELVDIHRILETNNVVSLGKLLSKSMIRVGSGLESNKVQESRGRIFIGSSERVCVVDSCDNDTTSTTTFQHPDTADAEYSGDGVVVWRDTGDVGEVLEDGRIVFVGREDDQIKRHGKRMTLSALEAVCSQLPWLSECSALMNEETQLIVLYVIGRNSTNSANSDGSDYDPTVCGNKSDVANRFSVSSTDHSRSVFHDGGVQNVPSLGLDYNSPEHNLHKERINRKTKEEHLFVPCEDHTTEDLNSGSTNVSGHTLPATNDGAMFSTASEELVDSKMEEHILRAHIADSLPSHYNPDRLIKLEAFPLTPHGKLDKKKLLEIAKASVLNTGMAQLSPFSWLSQLWMTYLPKGITHIEMSGTFLSLGGDSLAAVNLINQMEGTLGGSVPHLFMDTLLNKDFGACVQLLQDSLKIDVGSDGQFGMIECRNEERKHMVGGIVVVEDGGENRLKELQEKMVEKKKEAELLNEKHASSGTFCVGEISSSHLLSKSLPKLLCYTQPGSNTCMERCKYGVFGKGLTSVCVENQVDSNGKQEGRQCDYCQQQHSDLDDACTGRGNTLDANANSSQTESRIVLNKSSQPSHSAGILPTSTSTVQNTYCRKRVKRVRNKSQHSSDLQNSLPGSHTHIEERDGVGSPDGHIQLSLRWTMDTKKCVDASPVIAAFSPTRRLTFIGSHSGHFSAVDLDSGDTQWTTVLPDRIESSACVTRSMTHVVVGCYNGVIYVMDVQTGVVEWDFATGSCVKCSPCLDQSTGYVLCGSHDGRLYALDVGEKCCVWSHFLGGGSVYASPLVDPGSGLVFAASLSGKLVALKNTDGMPVWCADLYKPLFSSPCLHSSSVLIGCVDGYLYCVGRKQGDVEWKFNTQGPVFSSPISINGHIFLGSHSRQLFCLDSDGQMIWTFPASSPIFSTPFAFHVKVVHSRNTQGQGTERSIDEEPKNKMARRGNREEGNMFHSFSGPSNLSLCNSEGFDLNGASTSDLQTVNSDLIISDDPANDVAVKETRANDTIDSDIDGAGTSHQEKMLVTFASTEGTLHVVESEKGQLLTSTRVNGEVFSSPVFHDGKIVVGCRDNLLYCFDLYV